MKTLLLLLALATLAFAGCDDENVVNLPPGDIILDATKVVSAASSGKTFRGAADGSTRVSAGVAIRDWTERGESEWGLPLASACRRTDGFDIIWPMSDLRTNNTIFLMDLASNAYARRHGLTREQFLAADDRYHFLRLICKCPDYFDPLPADEIVDELDKHALRTA